MSSIEVRARQPHGAGNSLHNSPVDMPRLPTFHYTECVAWLMTIVPCLIKTELVLPVIVAALVRLVFLGPTAIYIVYFSGQPLIITLEYMLDIQLSATGTTALATCLLLPFWILSYKKSIDRMAQRDCILLGIWSLMVIGYLYCDYHNLPLELQDRFKLLTVQLCGAVVLTYHFTQDQIDTVKAEKAFVIMTLGVFLVIISHGAGFFEKTGRVPSIDLARCGGLAATVLFLIATSGRMGMDKFFSLAFSGISLLACMTQLTRQGIYAIPMAILATNFLFDRRKKLKLWVPILLIILLSFGTFPMWFGSIAEQIERLLESPEDGLSTRQGRYNLALKMFEARPWTGYGFGGFSETYGNMDYPHNMVLDILADFGLRGLAFCAIPFLLGVWSSFGMSERKLSQNEYLGINLLVAIQLYWTSVSMASYTLPHSCVCVTGMYLLVIHWRRLGALSQALIPVAAATTPRRQRIPSPHHAPMRSADRSKRTSRLSQHGNESRRRFS